MTHTLMKIVMLLTLCVVCICIALITYRQIQPKSPKLAAAEEAQRIDDIVFYGTAKQVLFVGTSTVVLLSVLALTYAYSRAKVKQASVYVYRIGKHNEFVVHERDLSLAAPIAMGLINAEQLKQMNGGVESAFELYTRMAEVQTRQIQALSGHAPGPRASAFQPQKPVEYPKPQTKMTPTFRELLLSKEIAFGKPIILGYQNGVPRRGSFLDIYSAALAGESGSGKTATLLFLIGSGLVSGPIRFFGIDPHYPHPKSLGFKTKPLWEAGLITMATFKDDMLTVLHKIESTIDRRLKQIDKETTPVVLVIDELAFLTKTSIGNAVTHTMERISTEGRKCAVYMLASSQTWLVSRTGNSSVVRDTLTSAFIHRIKPKQANLLLQNKEDADKVKKYVKHAGDVLLCPVHDDPIICKIPFTTDTDMHLVVELVGGAPAKHSPQKAAHTPENVRSNNVENELQELISDFEPAALPESEHSASSRPPAMPTHPLLTQSHQRQQEMPAWKLRNAA